MDSFIMKHDLIIRNAESQDGTVIWRLLTEAGGLDVNSVYSYMLLGRYFGDTCLLAESAGEAVGFVSGFQPPKDQQTIFIWQIAVHPTRRGEGIASRMLFELLHRKAKDEIAFIEATVSPSNKGSQALFEGMARAMQSELLIHDGFPAAWFPEGHEEEQLYRIGPVTHYI